MNICIFPGTFNPIHNGHLKMAEYALCKYEFDKIIFIPANAEFFGSGPDTACGWYAAVL